MDMPAGHGGPVLRMQVSESPVPPVMYALPQTQVVGELSAPPALEVELTEHAVQTLDTEL